MSQKDHYVNLERRDAWQWIAIQCRKLLCCMGLAELEPEGRVRPPRGDAIRIPSPLLLPRTV